MATKRKRDFEDKDNVKKFHVNKKNSLDSDEEDSDDYEKDELCAKDIEAEEDGVSKVQDEIKITPFNMREELEEGHFDKEGQYHWNNSEDVEDNWLDNIDWVKIKQRNEILKNCDADELTQTKNIYNETILYKQLLSYMIEGETVANSLRRLGKNSFNISSVERLKLKKKGIMDENGDKITKLSELANEILKTGNMDIYQTTFESIKGKVNSFSGTSKTCTTLAESAVDMYSDDFNEREKCQLHTKCKNSANTANELFLKDLWEFKWKEKDTALQGPFNTKQMLKLSKDGYFKNGVYVRKVGDVTNFYSSNRIDFELYL